MEAKSQGKKEFMKMNKMILLISMLVVSLFIMQSRSLNADTEQDPDIDIRLKFAIVQGDPESVIKFLEEGANANTIYDDGNTPLGEAISRTRATIDIVKALIHYGADPKIKVNGFSPLSLAQQKNDEELIRILYHYAESDVELYELALYYLNKEEESSALEYADEALKLNPFNVKAWALKGSIFLSQNYYNIKYAEMAYRKAFEASLINLKANKSEDDYQSAAWYALMFSDFNGALRVAKEGLLLFPEDGNLELNNAHAMLLLGRKKEAIDLYKKAYAGLQRSERYAERAAQVMTDDFANLIRRYPDKAMELRWAEEKIQGPFDFNFHEIPFGAGKDSVLGMVKGAIVKDENKPVLGRLDPVLTKQLRTGLYPADQDMQLNPDVVEKYSVIYEKWGALQSMDLFFTGKEGHRTLFLVSKFYRETGGIDRIFTRHQEAISKEIQIQPVVHATQIVSPSGPTPVKIAIWKSNNTTIFLDVLNVSTSSSQLRIMYISKNGWAKYVASADRVRSR